eukprot:c15960_g1_i1.p1 GENE.c15960_g1_i1~~c15960_g1_i1.p1  ORF type:complete len:214 (+),score=21.17 c15960_g1_i1:30-644(+)
MACVPLDPHADVCPFLTLASCGICGDIMVEPLMCPNQHTFGASCLRAALSANPECPICRSRVSSTQVNRTMRELIGNFLGKCSTCDVTKSLEGLLASRCCASPALNVITATSSPSPAPTPAAAPTRQVKSVSSVPKASSNQMEPELCVCGDFAGHLCPASLCDSCCSGCRIHFGRCSHCRSRISGHANKCDHNNSSSNNSSNSN